jgi:hypothetical protein
MSAKNRRAAFYAIAVLAATTLASVSAAETTSAPSITRAQVSHDLAVLAGEPYVMPDPLHPGVVTVVWLGTSDVFGHTTTAAPVSYCSIATTFDDGAHWTKPQPLPIVRAAALGRTATVQVNGHPDVICGDPVGGVGPDGTVYAGATALGSPSWEQGFSSLHTHGLSWDFGPTEMFGATQSAKALAATNYAAGKAKTPPAFFGRMFMAVDPKTGAVSAHTQEDGGLEGRWLVVSHDHGKTWTTPRPLDPDVQGKSAGPQGAANGFIALTYTVDPMSPTYLSSTKPAVKCAAQCLVFETTKNDGVTWERHIVTNAPGSAGTKFTSVDPTDTTGNRYALLLTTNSGHRVEVWTTSDRGRTWARHVVANAANGNTFIKPGLGYAPNGTLGAVWRTQHANGSFDMTATTSTTRGATWSKLVTLTNGPAPAQSLSGNLPGDDCSCNIGMTNSTLYTAWGDARTGNRELWFAAYHYA